ncbi:tetratricopeptide repeat protein, partial [bacterium]|nr:tetratricopeptide repeat protein [bacterium]
MKNFLIFFSVFFFLNSLTIFAEQNISNLEKLAETAYSAKNYKEAAYYYEKLLTQNTQAGNELETANNLWAIGELNLTLKNYDNAVKNFEDSIAL